MAITSTETKITPVLATKFLEGNVHNRELKTSRVLRYARQMSEGKWGISDTAISFDTEETLLNGQHRLFAVIESGVTIRAMVMRGLPPESREVIDCGDNRTVLDVLRLNKDAKTTSLHVAVSNAARDGLTGSTKSYGKDRNAEIEFFRRHQQAIETAIELFPKKIKSIAVAPVLGALARASYHLDHDVLRAFAAGLTEGNVNGPVRLLRDYLLTRRYMGGSAGRREVYGKTARALLAFAEGRTPTRLIAVSEEPFELPAR